MSVIDTLITNRTAEDVTAVKALNVIGLSGMTAEQKIAYLAGMKGAYNASDLNRVEEASLYMSELLRDVYEGLQSYAASLGVAPQAFFDPYDPDDYAITVKTDWTTADYISAADSARYLANVVLLTSAVLGDYPALPSSLARLDYIKANNIERSLVLLRDNLLELETRLRAEIYNASRAWYYSGDVYAGEVEA
ncbi:MAG: hypothetical protein IJP43_06195 [Oscillospiraceae bacterium]|nr:hypothetical protein [Oscillospiraceae bacterium]